ncbi:MAG: aminotransferase class V-fold PLP-dependent enzyme, partial [Myxococcales bacterium]|nr:aminotransferase class V-fold PLP-dependent enzyme [Myxococcales bacterium]
MDTKNEQATVYLDFNATAPIRRSVLDLFRSDGARVPSNPSSPHGLGRRAARRFEDACRAIATALGVAPSGVIITSGATESNNMAVRSIAPEWFDSVWVDPTAHASILGPLRERLGDDLVKYFPVDENGSLDLHSLDALKPTPKAIFAMAANNETGVLTDVARLADYCQSRGTWLHVDATQAIGRTPVDWNVPGIASVSFSGHKIGALSGVGAQLWKVPDGPSSTSRGGQQQRGRRAGTEPVVLAEALATATAEACAEVDLESARLRALRDRLEERLLELRPDIVFVGRHAARL